MKHRTSTIISVIFFLLLGISITVVQAQSPQETPNQYIISDLQKNPNDNTPAIPALASAAYAEEEFLNNFEREKNDLVSEDASLKNTALQLQNDIEHLKAAAGRLKNEYEDHNIKVKEHGSRRESLDRTNKAAVAAYNAEAAKLDKWGKELDARRSELAKHAEQLSNLEIVKLSLETQGGLIEKDLKALSTECGKLSSKDSAGIKGCKARYEDLSRRLQKHKKDINSFAFRSNLQSEIRRGDPVNAPLNNNTGNRSAYNYFKVIEQFEVEESLRYDRGKRTYCNIFAWDVTRAMGAEIPHWVLKTDRDGGSAVDPNGKFMVAPEKRQEMLANETVGWLKKHGNIHGWRRIDARMAQQMANEGHPSVAIWENTDSKSHGHIAVIRPGSVGDKRGPAISQAGSLVLDASHIGKGFNDPDYEKRIQYWYHE